jgi:hypothetical protein
LANVLGFRGEVYQRADAGGGERIKQKSPAQLSTRREGQAFKFIIKFAIFKKG